MKVTLDSFFNIDRRIVFVFVFLSLLIPMVFPYAFKCPPTRDVKDMYDAIEQATANKKTVFLSFEFDPTGAAEQEPMARAVVRHIFARGGKAVVMCKSGGQMGEALHLRVLDECAQEYGATQGEDYTYLPFLPGSTNLVINMGQSLPSTWSKDYWGKDLADVPVTRGIGRLADFDYVMIICAGLTTVDDWLTYGQAPYNLKMGFGVLGNAAPDCANFVNSGQIKGLLGGLIGPAQYEQIMLDKGFGLFRRFSAADLVSSETSGLCAKLAETGRSGVAAFVWERLAPNDQEAVQKCAAAGRDNLGQVSKKAVAVALNDAITRTDVITDAQLKDLKIDAKIEDLLTRDDLAAKRPQILRRLFVETAFPGALAQAQGAGQAMKWMTPQSIAHVVLIIAILFGNVCYFLERARRTKRARIGA